jgi:transcriptional regulator with XRE-family HTH domain
MAKQETPPELLDSSQVRPLRIAVNLNQKQLARLASVDRETVSRVEADVGKPKQETLKLLFDALDRAKKQPVTDWAALRRAGGLTLEELAERAGLSRDTLTSVEKGHHRPTGATLRGIRGALAVAAQAADKPRPQAELSRRLESLRMSATELANEAKVHPVTARKAVRMGTVRASNLRKLSDTLDTLEKDSEKTRPDADRIVQIRTKAGLSQRELAERIGVSQTCVSKIEKGARPRGRTLQAIRQVLANPKLHFNGVRLFRRKKLNSVKAIETKANGSQAQNAIRLDGPSQPIMVSGQPKQVTFVRYKVIKALVEAGQNGLSKTELEAVSPWARQMLKTMASSDPDWKKVIHMPGVTGGRYRVG